jgi:hypothetical protein
MFCCLTIEIDERQLRCFFGPGLIRRTIAVHEIVAARPVRNRWYYGWGIRLTPSGWMFNVSGLDAVELSLASGARFRVGTDRPGEVMVALGMVTTLVSQRRPISRREGRHEGHVPADRHRAQPYVPELDEREEIRLGWLEAAGRREAVSDCRFSRNSGAE